MPGKWVRWFERDADDSDEIDQAELEAAEKIIAQAGGELYQRLRDHIQRECESPLPIGSSDAAVATVARYNTLREIQSWLRKEVDRAERIVKMHVQRKT